MRRLGDRMDDARREWEHYQRQDDFLLPKGLLVQAEAQIDSLQPYLQGALQDFYQTSQRHEREQTAALEWAQVERDLRDQARRLQTTLRLRGIGENLAGTIALVGRNLQANAAAPLGIVQDTLHQGMTLAREQNRLVGHEGSVLSVAFSPDGQTIVSGSLDRTLRLWRGGTWHDWLAICCNRIRHHPCLKHPQTADARMACAVCETYVWAKEKSN